MKRSVRMLPYIGGIFMIFAFLVWGLVGYVIFQSFNNISNPDIPQLVLPGSYELNYDLPTSVDIYYEYDSIIDGQRFSTPHQWPNPELVLTNVQTGQQVPIQSPSGSITYNLPSASGYRVAQFSISNPGKYTLQTTDAEEQMQPIVVRVGNLNVVGMVFMNIAAIFVGIFAFFIMAVGVVMLVVGLVYRKKQLNAQK